MSKIFQFKQFSIDQTDCGMKINTDAALLGALAEASEPQNILEIGTGTGVITLMIAQRFPNALIDAIEIDEKAAITAATNFKNSMFSKQLTLIPTSFEDHFLSSSDKKYDLIVSNPPYFINSSRGVDPAKSLAKHTDVQFFENLIFGAANHLSDDGLLFLILPLDTAELVMKLSEGSPRLHLRRKVLIHSFPISEPYRCILVLGYAAVSPEVQKFVIYESQNVYSEEYRTLLKDYLIIF